VREQRACGLGEGCYPKDYDGVEVIEHRLLFTPERGWSGLELQEEAAEEKEKKKEEEKIRWN